MTIAGIGRTTAGPPRGIERAGRTRSGLPQGSRFGLVLLMALGGMGAAAGLISQAREPTITSLLLAVLAGLSATATT
jgi:hypothetical protein